MMTLIMLECVYFRLELNRETRLLVWRWVWRSELVGH